MNYQKSVEILKLIESANNIVLNCHRGPDPDGIGSTLAMKLVLEKMGKKIDIICPTKTISQQVSFLKGFPDIKLAVGFDNFNFKNYDLFITLDTPNLELLTGKDGSKIPAIKTIVIDHHHISTLDGDIVLLDEKTTSVGEILFLLFEDWVIEMNRDIAECLLTSIVGDTGAFSYPNSTSQTFRIIAKLMDYGVNKDMIVDKIYRSEKFEMLEFWSEVLSRMKIDKEGHFVYAMVPASVYAKFENLNDAKAKAAGLFAPIVEGTDFGFIGVEEKIGFMTVSFRGRTDFDTSVIAKELGGGGHKVASAAKLEGLTFDEAVEKVLGVARKYATPPHQN